MRLTVLFGNMFSAAVAGLVALGTTVGVSPFDCATAAGLQMAGKKNGGEEERDEERGHSGMELGPVLLSQRIAQAPSADPDHPVSVRAFPSADILSQGILKMEDGKVYDGDGGAGDGGKMEGPATYYLPDGGKIAGEMKGGKFEGPATYYFLNGGKTVGNMRDGEWAEGPATEHFPDGRRIEGEMKGGKFEGPATYYFPDDGKTVGNMRGGEWEGPATYYLPDGGKIAGEMSGGWFEGPATQHFPDGGIIKGEMKHGKWEGQATMDFPDGGKIVGEMSGGWFWALERERDRKKLKKLIMVDARESGEAGEETDECGKQECGVVLSPESEVSEGSPRSQGALKNLLEKMSMMQGGRKSFEKVQKEFLKMKKKITKSQKPI